MTEEKLSCVLSDHPKWPWIDGMRFLDYGGGTDSGRISRNYPERDESGDRTTIDKPDLGDAATQGVMLQMCRDAGAGEDAGIEFVEGGWALTSYEPGISHLVGYGWDTRGECLAHSWLRLQLRLGRIERGETWSDIG